MSDHAIEVDYPATPGVLLAGGLARRMGGGDKPMRMIAGQSILERAIARLGPQCDALVLNANGDPARFAALGLPVVSDSIEGFAGPLAGVLAGLDWMATNKPQAKWVLTAAADCPFLPRDLVTRLHDARRTNKARIVIAESGGRTHPVVALWDVSLRDELRHALTIENVRRVGEWVARFRPAQASWPIVPLDPFFNANTSEDLDEAARLAAIDAT
jgi:molybdopterin-guanine dinucleotide biosynthesis protein A